jgi:hypothetical protein
LRFPSGRLSRSPCFLSRFQVKEIRVQKSEMPKISNSVQSAAKCDRTYVAGGRAKRRKFGGSSPAKKRSAKSSIVTGSTYTSQHFGFGAFWGSLAATWSGHRRSCALTKWHARLAQKYGDSEFHDMDIIMFYEPTCVQSFYPWVHWERGQDGI